MYDIYISNSKENQEIIMVENGILTERIIIEKAQEHIEGNIYVGKVQNVLPGLQAAFIDIGQDKNTFIHLKDILNKVDETVENYNPENLNIKDLIKPGMEIIVQVKRAESNQKGARVSTHISLPGKYLVLMPNANFITISQKISNENEKTRLKNIFKELLPEGMGAIVRTSAEKKEKDVLESEINKLIQEWETIQKERSKVKKTPSLIYKGHNAIERILNDIDEKDINSIIVDSSDIYNLIDKKIKNFPKIKLNLSKNIYEDLDIQKQLEELSKRKIWLKCGGFITIDKTEALTAIDVNSGKFIGKQNLEQTVYTVNKEATIEIAKQLKLRDIGGIIIIDYIDMHDEQNKEKIEKLLKEELNKDRSKTQILGFTKLNLLEMTRKHINLGS